MMRYDACCIYFHFLYCHNHSQCIMISACFLFCLIYQGYLLKKGHVRRNWQERWFVLKPSSLAYYVAEDLKEKKGEIALDENSVMEVHLLCLHFSI